MRVRFGESHTYDWGVELSTKYDDPLVWSYAITLFLADWNGIFYIKQYEEEGPAKILGEATRENVRKIHNLVLDLKAEISNFRKMKLDEIDEHDLNELKPIITGLFERFSQIAGSTGASKALHILAPNFFMMWDDAIRKHYGLGTTANDYFEFLKRMRKEIREAVESYATEKGISDYAKAREALEKDLGKTPLKVMDEYNYITITRKIEL
ncbi:MAG: hypothetical protein ACTSXX_12385 [Candidatus Baldrarchaeia archaeon]